VLPDAQAMFMYLAEGVRAYNDYFRLKVYSTSKLGFSSIQKSNDTVRILGYEVADDLVDEHLRIGDSTCVDAMY
jgi:hypothetical protein